MTHEWKLRTDQASTTTTTSQRVVARCSRSPWKEQKKGKKKVKIDIIKQEYMNEMKEGVVAVASSSKTKTRSEWKCVEWSKGPLLWPITFGLRPPTSEEEIFDFLGFENAQRYEWVRERERIKREKVKGRSLPYIRGSRPSWT